MSAKNKRYRFSPALWAKWMARLEPDPHAPVLRAGIEQMRKSYEYRVETVVSINARISIEEMRAALDRLSQSIY